MADIWTIAAALDWTCGYLERKGDEHPRLSAEWLLSEATGLRRIELYANYDRPLSMEERDILRDYVRRRGAGEPLQYITGEVGFRYITVQVRPGVLIPRPETEVLVSAALSLLPTAVRPRAAEYRVEGEAPFLAEHQDQDLMDASDDPAIQTGQTDPNCQTPETTEILVADLGTGSGCIACSLASEHPAITVVATDISEAATELAEENARRLSLADRVQVIQGDLGEAIDPSLWGRFDAVISNPPYIPSSLLATIPREVSAFEPTLALDGGVDGLDVFRRILDWSRIALKPGGILAVELHEEALEQARTLAQEKGFQEVDIVSDLAGKPRVLTARSACP